MLALLLGIVIQCSLEMCCAPAKLHLVSAGLLKKKMFGIDFGLFRFGLFFSKSCVLAAFFTDFPNHE